jgi:hypothetical protein
MRHDAGKPKPSVGTPIQYSKSSEGLPLDAIRHNAGKPTRSVTTPIVTTPTQDTLYNGDEPRNATRHRSRTSRRLQWQHSHKIPCNAIRHDSGKPKPSTSKSLRSRHKAPYMWVRIDTPNDTTLPNGRRASPHLSSKQLRNPN